MVIYKETNGFYARYWNNLVWNTKGRYTWGNHGTLRQHAVVFADGHARPVLYDVATNANQCTNGQVIYDSNWQRRGGRLEQADITGPGNMTLDDIYHLTFNGPDWQEHCFPAPYFRGR